MLAAPRLADLARRAGAVVLAFVSAACSRKEVATAPPPRDAAPEATVVTTSCLLARGARAYVWRDEPLEIALDVELVSSCKVLVDAELELTDPDLGAKLGERKVKERYLVTDDGALAEWEDPFLERAPRLHAVLPYAVTSRPSSVGLRYGGVPLVTSIPLGAERLRTPPKAPSLRVVATSVTPGREAGENRLTVLVELDDAPRSAGRSWSRGGEALERRLFFEMSGRDHGATLDGEFEFAERVVDVDAALLPVSTPVTAMPVRPAKRLLVAERTTKMLRLERVTWGGQPAAGAKDAPKLLLPRETRARLDGDGATAQVDAGK